MASNFSLNVRRIRDLQEIKTPGEDFQPSASFVLVDAADDHDKYTTYKMSVSNLSAALSGMVSEETLGTIRQDFNVACDRIKQDVTNSIINNILSTTYEDDKKFVEVVSANVVNELSGPNGITATVVSLLTGQDGIAGSVKDDVVSAFMNDDTETGMKHAIVTSLTSDYDFAYNIATSASTSLANDQAFAEDVIGLFNDSKLQTILASLSTALVKSSEFIAAVKDEINNVDPEPEPDSEQESGT